MRDKKALKQSAKMGLVAVGMAIGIIVSTCSFIVNIYLGLVVIMLYVFLLAFGLNYLATKE